MENKTQQSERPRHRDDGIYYGLAIMVGLLAGAIGAVFHMLVDLFLGLHRGLKDDIDSLAVELLVFAAISMALVAVALFLTRRYAPEAGGSGVQEIEGALEGLRQVRWLRVLLVKFFAGVAALSSGLVLGREGPTIHMGAAVGAATAQTVRIDDTERKGLIAAGAAAGLAAAFNAPLAAVLFIIEETRRQFPYTLKTYTAVILASAFSGFMTEVIAGVGPDLKMVVSSPPLWHYPIFMVLGLLLGGFGVLFNRILLGCLNGTDGLTQRQPYLFPLLFAALVGVLLVLLPEATGGGDRFVYRLLHGHDYALGMLLLIFVVRSITTFGSYTCRIPGGIFAPMLALATLTGLIIGTVISLLVPDGSELDAVAMAIAAMGGLFTATVRAPLVGVVLVMELTGSYDLMLPVILTCVIANLTAHHLRGEPIYELLLERTLRQARQSVPDSTTEEARVPVELGIGKESEDKKGSKGD
ncbi:MAG: H(+)/Cl(-) exchange transporter ClcA [Pseudomonadota bacterium]